MSEQNVDAVRMCLEGWNHGDIDAWLNAVHPEIEWYSEVARRMEGAETVSRGLDEMRQFWDEWHSVWNLKIDISEIRDLGDTILVLANIRARGETSEIDLESPAGYVFEFEDGLARRARAYLDPRQAFEAVGLTE